jgi:hypothetical protein
MLMGALEVRDAFAAFQRETRGLGPDEFKRAWERFLADNQAHL